MIKGTLLIVDDNKDILNSLSVIMRNEFENVLTLNNPNRIIEILGKHDVDVVMLDMNFKSGIHNGNEGLFWMREIFGFDPDIRLVIVTASGDIELAVKAIKEKMAKKALAMVMAKKEKMAKVMLKPLWKYIKSNSNFGKLYKMN